MLFLEFSLHLERPHDLIFLILLLYNLLPNGLFDSCIKFFGRYVVAIKDQLMRLIWMFLL